MPGEDGAAAGGRSGNQSSVNSSIPFLTAPTMGKASRAVCASPPNSPLCRTEWARYATATAAPTIGTDFPSRRASFRPAHRPTRRLVVMTST